MLVCREAVTWLQLAKTFCEQCEDIMEKRTGQWERQIGFIGMTAAELALRAYMLANSYEPYMQYSGYGVMEEVKSLELPISSAFDEAMGKMFVEKESYFYAGLNVNVDDVVRFVQETVRFTNSLWATYMAEVNEGAGYMIEEKVLQLLAVPHFDK